MDLSASAWRARGDHALDAWTLVGGLAAAAAIIGAHLVERVGGYPPCFLCFVQRWAFWAAIAAAVLGLVAARRAPDAAHRLAAWALALVFTASALIAAFHAGVEWGFWPGPAFCTGAGERLSAEDLLAALNAAGPVVDCASAPFRILGLSMAGWNVVYSAGLAALSVIAARRRPQSTSGEPVHV